MPPKAWTSVWQETLAMLQVFPIPLVRCRNVDSRFGERAVLTTTLTGAHSRNGLPIWAVWGDRISRGLGDTCILYRDLDYYRNDKDWKDGDPLYCSNVIEGLAPFAGTTVCCRSQGEPYHFAMVCVGMILESRFPDHVFVHGDIMLDTAQMLKPWLDHILKEPVQLPICVDAGRLWNRLEGIIGDDEVLVNRFLQTYCGPRSRAAQWLLTYSKDATLDVYAERLATYTRASQFGAIDILQAVLEGSQKLDLMLLVVQRANEIKKDAGEDLFPLTSVLEVLCSRFVTLPKWEGQELAAFTKYMESEANALEMLNRTFLRMAGAPSRFNFCVDQDSLLNAFCMLEPSNRDGFAAIVAESNEKNRDKLKLLSDKIEATMEALDEDEDDELPTRESFPEWIRHLAEIEKPKFKNPEQTAREIGADLSNHLAEFESLGFFGDGELETLQRELTKVVEKKVLHLYEEAWDDLDKIESKQLLKLLILLAHSTGRGVEDRAWTRLYLQNPEYWSAFLDEDQQP